MVRRLGRTAVISEDLVEPWDEGIKNFARSLASALEKFGEVLAVNVARSGRRGGEAVAVAGSRTFLQPSLAKLLRSYRPRRIVYVPSSSSTLASFMRIKVLRAMVPDACLAMVALIPRKHPRALAPLLRLGAPRQIFVPSYRSLLRLRRLGLAAELLPLGVDLNKFHPARTEERAALRRKYGFNAADFVFLHVGHLSPRRRLEKLLALRSLGAEVVVVASTTTPADPAVVRRLEQGGVRLLRKYVAVEEYYRLSDRYVFPVDDSEGCIELPLSVLESLASGLPVLATPFGGLRDFLSQGKDLVYWRNEGELLAAARKAMSSPQPAVRKMEDYTWEKVAEKLLGAMVG